MHNFLRLCACTLALLVSLLPCIQGQTGCPSFLRSIPDPTSCPSPCGPTNPCQTAGDVCCLVGVSGSCMFCTQRTAPDCPAVTVANGFVTETVINNQRTLTISCQPGFIISGSSVLRCLGSTWDAPTPTCQDITATNLFCRPRLSHASTPCLDFCSLSPGGCTTACCSIRACGGRLCLPPIGLRAPPKLGLCSIDARPPVATCTDTCAEDTDCPGGQKCCPGQCPTPSLSAYTCVAAPVSGCQISGCASSGPGFSCVALPDRAAECLSTQCPAATLNSCPDGDVDQCNNDNQCGTNTRCCWNGCFKACAAVTTPTCVGFICPVGQSCQLRPVNGIQTPTCVADAGLLFCNPILAIASSPCSDFCNTNVGGCAGSTVCCSVGTCRGSICSATISLPSSQRNGVCPLTILPTFAQCSTLCNADHECPNGQKCCPGTSAACPSADNRAKGCVAPVESGCQLTGACSVGFVCTSLPDRISECFSAQCPAATRTSCPNGDVDQCSTDTDCNTQRCCWNGCFKSCLTPIAINCQAPNIRNGRFIFAPGSPQDFRDGTLIRFECNPGYSLGTQDALATCRGGVWSPRIPVCQVVTCPVLVIPNANISSSSTAFGTRVRLQCIPGYFLSGDAEIVCQQNGQWSDIPVCRREGEAVLCTALLPPANGRIVSGQGLTTVGSVTAFACNNNFQLRGSSRRVCQSNGVWDGQQPACILICLVPTPRANGQVSIRGDGSPGTIVVYTCDPGYIQQGPGQGICQASSQRYEPPPPECRPAFCNEIPTPRDGVKDPQGPVQPGATVRFACNQGYRLVGVDLVRCLSNGAYDQAAPTCQPVPRCPDLPQSPNRREQYSNDRLIGSVVQFACAQGYQLDGVSSLRCEVGGVWNGQPPVCRVITCPDLPQVPNAEPWPANITHVYGSTYTVPCLPDSPEESVTATCSVRGNWDISGSCPIFACPAPPTIRFGRPSSGDSRIGARVNYQCDGGYVLTDPNPLICEQPGVNQQPRWNRNAPSCVRTCPTPPQIPFGSVRATGSSPGNEAVYICNEGYALVSNNRLICRDFGRGQPLRWDGQIPECRIRGCGELPNLANAAEWREGLSNNVGSSHRVPCMPGFSPQEIVATCTQLAQWEYSTECSVITCAEPGPPRDGTITRSDNRIGSTVRITCNNGYLISGSDVLTCRNTDRGPQYIPELPRCLPITCMPLMSPSNGRVELPSSRVPNSIARYSCEGGYNLRGARELLCEPNGMWRPEPPICEPVRCDNTLNFANAINSLPPNHNNRFGSRYNIPCVDGFMPDSILIYCAQSAVWETVQRCVAAPRCPRVHSPNAGGMAVDGYTLSFVCNPGFERQGPMNITCLNGRWDGVPPVCVPIPGGCSRPGAPANGPEPQIVRGTEGHVGAVYRFSCFSGYQLEGATEIRCDGNSQFNAAPPTCRRIERCEQQFGNPDNGQVRYTIDSQGQPRASFLCNPGYQVRGSAEINCVNNRWNGVAPICERIPPSQCGRDFPYIPDGQVRYSTDPGGQPRADFACNSGYQLRGSATVFCVNGRWTGAAPFCERVAPSQCGRDFQNIPNGQVRYSTGPNGQSRADFVCNGGYQLRGSATLFCENGRWNGGQPVCVAPSQCGQDFQNIPNGQVRYSTSPDGQFRADFFCNGGYQLRGSATVICVNGRWNGGQPTCVRVATQCGQDFANIANGQVRYSTDQDGRQRVDFACNSGYQLRGSPVLFCENGAWNGGAPGCEAETTRRCSVITLDGVQISYTNNGEPGSVARFSCLDAGLTAPPDSTCRDGNWDPQPRACSQPPTAGCQAFAVLGNAQIQYIVNSRPVATPTPGALVPVNTEVNVQCPGGQLDGAGRTICQSNGAWNPAPPTNCAAGPVQGCPVLALNGGTVSYSAFGSPGSVATFDCPNGRTFPPSTCRNGAWDPRPPSECGAQPTGCPAIVVESANLRYQLRDQQLPTPGRGAIVPAGTILDVLCPGESVPNGASRLTCQPNGAWDQGRIPSRCEVPRPPVGALCRDLRNQIPGGNVEYIGFTGQLNTGAQARVTCNTNPPTAPVILRCDNGNWFPNFTSCVSATENPPTELPTARPPPPVSNPCFLPFDQGNCDRFESRYYFNPQSNSCETFEYGGCGGNANNFRTVGNCREVCVTP